MCRILGRGRNGTVWLALHKDLEEYRAIKQVPKAGTGYHQFRQEALILKTLRHPGIPIVYDLEEDEAFSYLIEEFLEGDSLYALISDLGHFSTAMTIHYGIQICHLVNYLHFAEPTPILYLDLQPKNLLLCNNSIKLVDFDHAVHLQQAEQLTKRYGTVGCAAPEQYTGEALDERTDIYAIGAVLYYMLTGCFPGTAPAYPSDLISPRMVRIIKICLQPDKRWRYQSVRVLREQLQQIQREEDGVFAKDQLSSLTIAVTGTGPGAGTTHIAMGLASYLTRQGILALYEEKDNSGGICQLAAHRQAEMDPYGIYRIYGQPMLPHYGTAVNVMPHPWRIVVQDHGSSWNRPEIAAAGMILLISSGKPWKTEQEQSAYQSLGNLPGLAVIYNHFSRRLSVKPQGLANGTTVFFMPNFTNPFTGTKQSDQCFREIWADRIQYQQGGKLRNLFKNMYRILSGTVLRITDIIRSG
ncbi:MAG: serine/threonine protein kinase [Lachnospiraceae bacterium]